MKIRTASQLMTALAALALMSGCGFFAPPTNTPSGNTPGDGVTSGNENPPEDPPKNGGREITDTTGDPLPQGAVPFSQDITPKNLSYTVPEYLDATVQDLDAKWSQWFISIGYSEPMVNYHIVTSDDPATYVSQCVSADGNNITVRHDTPNAYYCSSDDAIWLPATTFEKMWYGDVFSNRSARNGDFAAGMIVAHEFGHHVADELEQQATAMGATVTPLTAPNRELIADCFAGVYAATLYYDGRLEDGDPEEAIEALRVIADPPGAKVSHGTPEQRIQAFNVGYNTEVNPGYCIDNYWK